MDLLVGDDSYIEPYQISDIPVIGQPKIEFLPNANVRLRYFTIENGHRIVVLKIIRSLSDCSPEGIIMRSRNRLLM